MPGPSLLGTAFLQNKRFPLRAGRLQKKGMIFDHLQHASLYRAIHPRIAAGFDFLSKLDLATLPVGRTSLEGDALFAIRQEYDSRPVEGAKWEAHRKYADIQFIYEGEEQIGYAPLGALAITEAYSAERDVLFLEGRGDFIRLRAGEFAIFYPQDAHLPGIAVAHPARVGKVVVKVQIAE